jgi:hypothetical protein
VKGFARQRTARRAAIITLIAAVEPGPRES